MLKAMRKAKRIATIRGGAWKKYKELSYPQQYSTVWRGQQTCAEGNRHVLFFQVSGARDLCPAMEATQKHKKRILAKNARCFWCTKKGHRARQCYRSVTCAECNRRHATTMCDPKTSKQRKSRHVKAVELLSAFHQQRLAQANEIATLTPAIQEYTCKCFDPRY